MSKTGGSTGSNQYQVRGQSRVNQAVSPKGPDLLGQLNASAVPSGSSRWDSLSAKMQRNPEGSGDSHTVEQAGDVLEAAGFQCEGIDDDDDAGPEIREYAHPSGVRAEAKEFYDGATTVNFTNPRTDQTVLTGSKTNTIDELAEVAKALSE